MKRWLVGGVTGLILLLCGCAFSPSSAQGGAADPDIVLTTGHSGNVNAVAFSPDSLTIASASADNTIKLWDAASGRELRTLKGHSEAVNAITFSSDGHTIVSGSDDGSIKLWDVETGRELRTLTQEAGIFGKDAVVAVAISPDGRTIASVTNGGLLGGRGLRLWEAGSGRELPAQTRKSSDEAIALAFSPDGRTIVSGNADNTVTLRDAANGRTLRTLKGHSAPVYAVAYSPDGRTIVSASSDKTLKLWDSANGRALRTLGGQSSSIAVAFSPDGQTVMSGAGDATLTFWEAASGRGLRTLEDPSGSAKLVAFSPDGRTIVTVGEDAGEHKTLKLWDVASGQELRELVGRSASANALAISPDGRIAVSASDDTTLRLWDMTNGRALRRLAGHSGKVTSVAFAPDGRTIVSGSADKTLKLWDAKGGRALKTLVGHSDVVSAVAFSVDGQTIVSGSDDKTVKLWDAVSGLKRQTLEGHSGWVNALAISPDGRTAVAATTPDTPLKLWDITSGQALRSLGGHASSVSAVAFSPDGRTMVSGSLDKTLKLWDVASGREQATLTGHSDAVNAVAFSPNGRMIVSGSNDETIRFWDAATGRELRTIAEQPGVVNAIVFSRDGRAMASAGADGTVKFWSPGGELLTTSVSGTDGEWLTLTPEGFFDASSPKAAEVISIVRGFRAYSIYQFYNQLYRPDLVREKLAGDPQGKVRAAAAKLDLSKAIASGNAPRVVITNPSTGASISGEQATVDVEITDQGGGIGRVEWRVNGVTLGVEDRGFKRIGDQSGQSIKVARQLSLAPGENRIAVLAYNQAGLIASEPVEIAVSSVQEKSTAAPRLYVLAVGVNNYWDSALRLNFATQDAKSLADGLRQAGGKLYERVEIKTMLDDEATAEKLDGAFTELGNKVRPQDVFVFFLAGHGKTVDARFYFLPQDFHYTDADSIVRKGVGQDQLQAWLSLIRAQKSVLLFDACESGSLIGDRLATRGIEEKTATDRMTRAMGRTVLTATTDNKPAMEGYRGHGAFTYTLLAGLNAADANADGVIDVTELAQYVDQALPELTYTAFQQRQIPQMSIVGSNFPFASRVTVLPSDEGAAPVADIPTKPTHVVISPASVRQTVDPKSPVVSALTPGWQVRIIETGSGWALIARDGKRLGYVEAGTVVPLQ